MKSFKILTTLIFGISLLIGSTNMVYAEEKELTMGLTDEQLMYTLEIAYSWTENVNESADYFETNKTLATEEDLLELKTLLKEDGNLVANKNTNGNISTFALVYNPNFSTYFYSSKWISRSGIISLSIDWKNAIYGGITPYIASNIAKSWDSISIKHSRDKYWKNATSLYNQYICHVNYARMKNIWNIEPGASSSDYWMIVAAGCNPR